MEPLTKIAGAAVPMAGSNIDTDVIMPKQFLKGIDRLGLGEKVFYDQRYDEHGRERPDFILNRAGWEQPRFIVTGPNFGCGSSREHAVWGLLQIGVRALIGTSFAGIFNDNCQRNGLLTVSLPEGQIEALRGYANDATRNRLELDLPSQAIITKEDGRLFPFEIDQRRKHALLHGLDPIGSVLKDAALIRSFEQTRRAAYPWL